MSSTFSSLFYSGEISSNAILDKKLNDLITEVESKFSSRSVTEDIIIEKSKEECSNLVNKIRIFFEINIDNIINEIKNLNKNDFSEIDSKIFVKFIEHLEKNPDKYLYSAKQNNTDSVFLASIKNSIEQTQINFTTLKTLSKKDTKDINLYEIIDFRTLIKSIYSKLINNFSFLEFQYGIRLGYINLLFIDENLKECVKQTVELINFLKSKGENVYILVNSNDNPVDSEIFLNRTLNERYLNRDLTFRLQDLLDNIDDTMKDKILLVSRFFVTNTIVLKEQK